MKRRVDKEKIFFLINIFLIIGIIIFYLIRAIYYYKKTNYIPKSDNLYSIIVNLKNMAVTGEDGLYNKDETYYFKGKEVKNYLQYSGLLWRIVEINDTSMKLISEDNLTSLVYGINTDYENSYIINWLNNGAFINGLYNKDEFLLSSEWCNENVDVNNYVCNNKIERYVGLLSTEEYLQAGGKNSYLNNENYWWTLNTTKENKVYYVQSEGEIEDQSDTISTYHSYGVRPVIVLKSNVEYLGGDGSIKDPYVIDNNMDIEINNHSIGTYVSYNEYLFRIMEINTEYTKLILDGYLLDDNNEPLELSYNEINSYLENNFLSKFDKDNLVSVDYYYGTYDNTNNYNYDFSDQNKINSYVGIPVIGDMHISEYTSVWLNNKLTSDENLVYKTTKVGSVFADFSTSKNYVRPIICIKKGLIIAGGEGTKSEPLVIGDKNEIEIEN